MGEAYAGLHGLIEQLPAGGRWTADRRERWLEALVMVLDFSVAVYAPKTKDDEGG